MKNRKVIDINNFKEIYEEQKKIWEGMYGKYFDKMFWEIICCSNYQLTEDFIRKYHDKVDWRCISIYQNLSENLIREFCDKVDWIYISINQKLSEEFIEEFQHKVDWYSISEYQKLSEEFIKKFQNRVNWYFISKHQELSESFISEFQHKLNMNTIIEFQELSEDFARKELAKNEYLLIKFIKRYKDVLSYEFIMDFIDYIDINLLDLNNRNDLTEEQKNSIRIAKELINN